MKRLKRCMAMLLCFVMLLGMVPMRAEATTAPYANGMQFIQRNNKWSGYVYGGGVLGCEYNEKDGYGTGCGIFSLANAVYALTGKKMDVIDVAQWAYDIGAFNNPKYGLGTVRGTLYSNVTAKYGATYGFKVDVPSKDEPGYWAGAQSTTLINHLKNGGVAIGHVPGHFIALVGYENNKFLVYDCAYTTSRGTTKNGDWKTAAQLNTGKMKLDWFCLLSATNPSTSPTAPTVANLSINKLEFKIGEEFTFTLSSDAVCDYYLSIIDADSGEYIITGENVSSTYKNSFQKAGHYVAWMSAANSMGSKDSNFVDFWVFGSPPTTAYFNANKTEMALGETVTLTTTTNAYYVKIAIALFLYNDTNNGTKVRSGEIPYNFNYTPTEKGIYTGYVTAWTHEGGIDSNWITFYVGEYNVSYNANGGSGAPSSQTKTYGTALTLSSTIPTRTGYTFVGWSTNATATSAEYSAGVSFTVNADTTLYAVWEIEVSSSHLSGDIDSDGKISNADLVILARYIVGLENSANVKQYGDINGDDIITNADLVALARIIVGLE